MRLFKHYNKRVMVPMVLAGAVILGNAFAAFATHEACTDEPAGSPNSVHAGTQDSWVWVSQPGPISGVIGVDANNLAAVTGHGHRGLLPVHHRNPGWLSEWWGPDHHHIER